MSREFRDDPVDSLRRLSRDHIGVHVDAHDLEAALGAVAIREAQASSKLSPVVQPPTRSDGSRSGPHPVPPYVTATFASFASCPTTCSFLHDEDGRARGCFVSANVNTMRLMVRLDESARRISLRERASTLIGLAEATLIDATFPDGVPQDGPDERGRALRLHVAGDAANAVVARALGSAVARWQERGGGPAWTFTHAWRRIARDDWGRISVLASVESPDSVPVAIAQGYAPALVVPRFPNAARSFPLPGGTLALACPVELGQHHADGRPKTCASCGWCFDDRRLRTHGRGIAFATHGRDTRAAATSIDELADARARIRRSLPTIR